MISSLSTPFISTHDYRIMLACYFLYTLQSTFQWTVFSKATTIRSTSMCLIRMSTLPDGKSCHWSHIRSFSDVLLFLLQRSLQAGYLIFQKDPRSRKSLTAPAPKTAIDFIFIFSHLVNFLFSTFGVPLPDCRRFPSFSIKFQKPWQTPEMLHVKVPLPFCCPPDVCYFLFIPASVFWFQSNCHPDHKNGSLSVPSCTSSAWWHIWFPDTVFLIFQ